MSNFLFDEFNPLPAKAWKQKIQVDLQGADYNQTLLWHTDEGIIVKPFYTKEDRKNTLINLPKKDFNICQTIFIDDEKIANSLAIDAVHKGANSIQFKATKTFDYKTVLKTIDVDKTIIYFKFSFLNADFQIELANFCSSKNTFFRANLN